MLELLGILFLFILLENAFSRSSSARADRAAADRAAANRRIDNLEAEVWSLRMEQANPVRGRFEKLEMNPRPRTRHRFLGKEATS